MPTFDFTMNNAIIKNYLQEVNSLVFHTPRKNLHYINMHHISKLEYDNFFREHMIKNVPCTIRNVSNGWTGLKWIDDNKPNFEYLIKNFGDAIVPVADCGSRYFNAQKKEEQSLKEYLVYWKEYIRKDYPKESPCLYLKDWHFARDFPNERMYSVPHPFDSDWLNEYLTSGEDIKDDYRFVYMGPKGSWTPLHADVFSSFSWSVNLCGKKRWVLYPPGEEQCFIDKCGNLAYDVESPLLQDSSQFKNYNKLETSFEIIQNAGEAIFVPSGWHHQVWNLDDTISVNHNWVNSSNIGKMWTSLRDNLSKVKLEISDCEDMDDWHNHCQLMLNSVYGLDYTQFCNFLLYIISARTKHLIANRNTLLFDLFLLADNHLLYDLQQAKTIFQELISDDDFAKLDIWLKSEWSISATLQEAKYILDEILK